jgi:hypothetical protein
MIAIIIIPIIILKLFLTINNRLIDYKLLIEK